MKVGRNDKSKALSNPKTENGTVDSIRKYLHAALELRGDWVMVLPILSARADEKQHTEIDFQLFWLPANSVYPFPTPLVSQPALCATVALAVSAYWSNARTEKSRHTRAKSICSNLVKAFEFAWMTNRMDISKWRRADFDEFATLLGEGGWENALNIRQRLTNFCKDSSIATIHSLTLPDSGIRQTSINTSRFCKLLGTNVQGKGVKVFHPILRRLGAAKVKNRAWEVNVESAIKSAKLKQPTVSMLRDTFDSLNYAFDLPADAGWKILPYPARHLDAKRLGKRVGRTPNLGAKDAALLFAEGFRWLYIYGPDIVNLLEEVCDSVIAAHLSGRKFLGDGVDKLILDSKTTTDLNEKLPLKIVGADMVPSGMQALSLRSAILCLFSACFFLAATMNARRRDEIAHRRFGMFVDSVLMIDADLELYQCEFYIEKTYCEYMQFYVNRATKDIVEILSRVQALYNRVDFALARRSEDTPVRERSLWCYRRISCAQGIHAENCWFEFVVRKGGPARGFVTMALGDERIKITPHMFRRAYALIFYYQYSNATLQALSAQLRHATLSTTMVYVTDPYFIEGAKDVKTATNSHRTREEAFALEAKGIKKELQVVSDEMLGETVLAILLGSPSIGGYQRYIRFVYSRLSKLIEFDKNDLDRAIPELVTALKTRGHAAYPLRHGQCMAGRTTSTHLARCKDSGGELDRSLAKPATCMKCPFHYSDKSYLANLQADLTSLREISNGPKSVESLRAAADSENLDALIQIYLERLGGDSE